ncbi:MAG: hypothetical protein FWD91_04450 [Treponema sp.]|nr:hypothetical protein [Treponema sp.]
MKKLTEKWRRLLRRIFIAFGVAAISITFAACYGMPMPDDYSEDEETSTTKNENEQE